MVMSSEDEVHAPFAMVHRMVREAPIVNAVKVVLLSEALVIVPVPAVMVHVPVPTVGALAAIVVEVALQKA